MTSRTRPPYEILEHTADIGLRAWGETREALFEICAFGLAEILGRRAPYRRSWADEGMARHEAAEVRDFEVRASDIEALLVDWLNEILFTLETKNACLLSVAVLDFQDTWLEGSLEIEPCLGLAEGTELKAATYHQLSVRKIDTGWEATVYFDV